MNVPFVKMSGAGNDMILIDHRAGFLRGREASFAAAACDRRFGIGADGVILLGDRQGEEDARGHGGHSQQEDPGAGRSHEFTPGAGRRAGP